MKRISIAGDLRTGTGTKESKLLRANNQVPCVLYGGEEPKHFSLDAIKLDKFVFTPEVYLYELELEGKTYLASMKEVQFHPVSDRPIHVDFLELKEDEITKVAIPVKLIGTPLGVRNGGRLAVNYRKITVMGLPGKLPAQLEVNVEDVRIGQSIRVGEIEVNDLEILEDPKNVLMAVKMARAVIEEEELEEEGEEGEEGEAPAEGGEEAPAAEADNKEGGEG